jgi:transposase
MRDLRELSRERESLTQMRTRSKNRLAALKAGHNPLKATVKRLKGQVAFCDKQIAQIESEMAQITNSDEALSTNYSLLVSVPHVGPITAYTIMSETDCFNLFENRNQLIKYAGLDILDKSSGTSVRGKSKISKRGNSRLRSAPYPGLIAISQSNDVFAETYFAAIERGMVPKQARTAVVRQVLRVAFGVAKSGKPYSEAVHRNRTMKRVGEPEDSPTVTDLVA